MSGEPGTTDARVISWGNAAPTVEGTTTGRNATAVAGLNEQRSLVFDLLRLA